MNTTFFCQHYEDNHNHNIQMCYILRFIETKIHHASINVHKLYIHKYTYISIDDGHGLTMMYDIHIDLYFSIQQPMMIQIHSSNF